MSTIYDDLKDYFAQISEHYRELTGDGKLSFGDVMLLTGKASASFIQLVERFTDTLNGPEKKEIVLEAIGKFYDEVIKPLDITAIPNIVEPVVDTAIKQVILTFASASIDTIVAIFNKNGWNPDPLPGPQAHADPSRSPTGEVLDKKVVLF